MVRSRISKTDKQPVDIQWNGTPISKQSEDIKINIEVLSRRIKNQEKPPADVLFRTHQYEFRVFPTQQFYEWVGRRSGFVVELKLFKKRGASFQEYTLCGAPVIASSFTEDPSLPGFSLCMTWPDTKVQSWKGEFCFRLALFRKVDDDTYRRITTKISSTFSIYSKPEVYLRQQKKRKQQAEVEATDCTEDSKNIKKKETSNNEGNDTSGSTVNEKGHLKQYGPECPGLISMTPPAQNNKFFNDEDDNKCSTSMEEYPTNENVFALPTPISDNPNQNYHSQYTQSSAHTQIQQISSQTQTNANNYYTCNANNNNDNNNNTNNNFHNYYHNPNHNLINSNSEPAMNNLFPEQMYTPPQCQGVMSQSQDQGTFNLLEFDPSLNTSPLRLRTSQGSTSSQKRLLSLSFSQTDPLGSQGDSDIVQTTSSSHDGFLSKFDGESAWDLTPNS